jgi:hypothetical protein
MKSTGSGTRVPLSPLHSIELAESLSHFTGGAANSVNPRCSKMRRIGRHSVLVDAMVFARLPKIKTLKIKVILTCHLKEHIIKTFCYESAIFF